MSPQFLSPRQGSIVCLHVLPYNYPVLMKLMDQLGQMPSSIKMAPPPAWRQELDRFGCPWALAVSDGRTGGAGRWDGEGVQAAWGMKGGLSMTLQEEGGTGDCSFGWKEWAVNGCAKEIERTGDSCLASSSNRPALSMCPWERMEGLACKCDRSAGGGQGGSRLGPGARGQSVLGVPVALRYCASIPPYYLAPLRVAFKRMGLPSQFIPEMRAEGFPPFLANYLKHLYRQAKAKPPSPLLPPPTTLPLPLPA